MTCVELHCHSYYSFHDGASSLEELLVRAKELGYTALALTDHDNLCGAMRFAHLAQSVGVNGITGAELTLAGGSHLTVLAKNQAGYRNLCRLITAAHSSGERDKPELDPDLLKEHASGLIVLSGCPQGELSKLVTCARFTEAGKLIRRYVEWFGAENYYVELQHNLAPGDADRNERLFALSREAGVKAVATGNVHYHIRERHELQDCLVAIRCCKSLEETHRERRANSEYYLRPPKEVENFFRDYPGATANAIKIAEQCTFDLIKGTSYSLPDYPAPDGLTPDRYLEKLCYAAAERRYGGLTPAVRDRLEEEFRLIRKYKLAGFLLLYHEVIKLGREVMIDLGLSDPSIPLEDNPPGRGRGSSVALLVGYLIGLSHIDPLRYRLSLERFLPDDSMTNVPDIDLDFSRSIREELILRTHAKWGWDHAALTGTIVTYQIKGAIRDLGKALGLPPDELDQLADLCDYGSAHHLEEKMERLPAFKAKIKAPVWRDLIRLAAELDGFPKYLGQHPGGMILSSTPLIDIVPVQRGAIQGRYVCQWDKDDIDDAGFVKIDFLALGALSQIQQALDLIKQRTGKRVDVSRIDFDDSAVYDMLGKGDTIGIFQVESAAQIQTITRLKPRNLLDMAHEVGAVRPGVGVNNGVQEYLARRSKRRPVIYDHPLEKRALERTLGVVLFQDQVNQLAIDVAGFAPSEADRLRRAFGRHHNEELIKEYHRKFCEGAKSRGVSEEATENIFKKFNGLYMFPESHAFAFGVTAYQASWLKLYYPIEFFVGLFNEQPMGFYNLETLKEDAKRHGVRVLNPDVNRSRARCTIENDALRIGFLNILGLGAVAARAIEKSQDERGVFKSIGEFLESTGILEETALNMVSAGAFDSLAPNRRKAAWEVGLRYRPVNQQLTLPLPVEQDMVELEAPSDWDRMKEEYKVLSLFPGGHVMAALRPRFNDGFICSKDIGNLQNGAAVMTVGLIIRRQRPHGKAVFITLEDEFGHIPCLIFPQVYKREELNLRSPLIIAKGVLSRREGTHNVIIEQVRPLNFRNQVPALPSRDWR